MPNHPSSSSSSSSSAFAVVARRRDRLVPRLVPHLVVLGLLLLSAPPMLFGAMRLAGVALGRATLPEHDRITAYPLLLIVHIVGATAFAMLGALQFAPTSRRRRWHRVVGRAVAPLGIITALSGIVLALILPLGDGDLPLLRGLRLASGCAIIAFIIPGLLALSRRDFVAHGAWMTRAYAIGVSSGTQFFTVAPYALLAGGRSVPITVLLMSAGWAINIGVAEWSLRRRRATTHAPRLAARSAVVAIAFIATTCLLPRVADAGEPEDRARMKELLDAAAESGRDKRISDGAGALGHGVIFAGVGIASWVTESTPKTRELRDVVGGVLVGTGGLMLLAGTYSPATQSELEQRRDAYVAALRGGTRPEEIDAAVREAERALFAEAEVAKTERTAMGIASFVFGAAEITVGIALETTTDDSGLRWLGRGLIVGGVGAGIIGTSAFAIRSEEERLADRWRNERALPPAQTSRSTLKLVPRLGFGQIGIAGTF